MATDVDANQKLKRLSLCVSRCPKISVDGLLYLADQLIAAKERLGSVVLKSDLVSVTNKHDLDIWRLEEHERLSRLKENMTRSRFSTKSSVSCLPSR